MDSVETHGILPFVYILKKRARVMMDEKLNFSYLFGSNAPYIEELYENFLENPNSVDEKWKQYSSVQKLLPGAGPRPKCLSLHTLLQRPRVSPVRILGADMPPLIKPC